VFTFASFLAGIFSLRVVNLVVDRGLGLTTSSPLSLIQEVKLHSTTTPSFADWASAVDVQKSIQHDYCIRHFSAEPPREDLRNTTLKNANGHPMDFIVYDANDFISGSILETHTWEPHISQNIIDAMSKVVEKRQFKQEDVTFLDIGGNIGVHTTIVQAAGFPVITFEPLPQNEAIIRTNLCFNDPLQERVTLFTKGLGAEPTLCKEYSAPFYNRGNGVVSCDGNVPQHADGELTYKGQMEIVRMDDFFPAGKAGEPPSINIGVMKMDVEGFEYNVIQGGKNFFTTFRIPFLVFELGRMIPDARKETLAFFYSLGYQASTSSFFQGMSQPADLEGVEDVYMALDAH
jgi:FkbM family methyltransferase